MTSDKPAQGWRRAYDHGQTGQFYYYNAASQRSSWSMPSGESLRRSVEPLKSAALLDIEKTSLRGENQRSNRQSPGRNLIVKSPSSSSSLLSRVQKLRSSGRALPSSSSASNTSSISSVMLAQQEEKRQRLLFCGERGIVHRGEKPGTFVVLGGQVVDPKRSHLAEPAKVGPWYPVREAGHSLLAAHYRLMQNDTNRETNELLGTTAATGKEWPYSDDESSYYYSQYDGVYDHHNEFLPDEISIEKKAMESRETYFVENESEIPMRDTSSIGIPAVVRKEYGIPTVPARLDCPEGTYTAIEPRGRGLTGELPPLNSLRHRYKWLNLAPPAPLVPVHRHAWDDRHFWMALCDGDAFRAQDYAEFWMASQRGDLKKMKFLLCSKSSISFSASCTSSSPLAYRHRPLEIGAAVPLGWSVRAHNLRRGSTALHLAVANKKHKVIKYLLAYHPEITRDGATITRESNMYSDVIDNKDWRLLDASNIHPYDAPSTPWWKRDKQQSKQSDIPRELNVEQSALTMQRGALSPLSCDSSGQHRLQLIEPLFVNKSTSTAKLKERAETHLVSRVPTGSLESENKAKLMKTIMSSKQRKLDIVSYDDAHETPLLIATRLGDEKSVRMLLHHDSSTHNVLHARDAKGSNAAHIAAERGHLAILQMLVRRIRLRSDEELPAREKEKIEGCTIVRVFDDPDDERDERAEKQKGARWLLNSKDFRGATPLLLAARRCNLEPQRAVMWWLLAGSFGDEAEAAKDEKEYNTVHQQPPSPGVDTFQMLEHLRRENKKKEAKQRRLNSKPKFPEEETDFWQVEWDCHDKQGTTPFMMAAKHGDLGLLQYLESHGALRIVDQRPPYAAHSHDETASGTVDSEIPKISTKKACAETIQMVSDSSSRCHEPLLPEIVRKMHARDYWHALETSMRSRGEDEKWEQYYKPSFPEKMPPVPPRARRIWLDRPDISGRTALTFAASFDHHQIVEWLLSLRGRESLRGHPAYLVDESARNGGGLGLRPMDVARNAGFTVLARQIQTISKDRAREEKERRDALIYGKQNRDKDKKRIDTTSSRVTLGTNATEEIAVPEDTRVTIPLD